MLWPSILDNARLRAQPSQLRQDCTATLENWLRATSNTSRSDAELARWVLTENGAGLRERWIRQLEEVVGEVVGPIWSKMDAAEEEDIAAADGDGVVLEAFEGFAFQVEDLVGAVLESDAVLPHYADEARKTIAGLPAKGADDADAGEQCLPDEWPIMPLWEWLGGYLAPPLAEPPGPGWERVARIEGGHRPDGTRAPDLWIHRPTAPARYLMVFAASLWDSEWAAEAETFYRRRVPAMPRAVMATFADVAGGEIAPSTHDSGVFVLRSDYQPRQPTFSFYPVTIAPEAIVALPNLLNRVGVRRLLRELSRRSWRQFQAQADAAHIITFLGGWQALADELKTNRADMKHVREVAKLLSGCSWTLPSIGAEGFGLWNFSYKRGSRRGPGRIRFELADILTPGGVARITGNSPTQRAARHLIPVPMQDPLTVGRPNEAGSELILQDLVLMRFRSHAEDYLRHDGVHLPWIELATRAGLPSSAVPRIVDAWCDPSDGWLMRSGRGATARFQVADSEMDGFIRDGARLQMQGRESQRRARERRNSRHRKH